MTIAVASVAWRSQTAARELMTLCFPCYATKGLRAHAELLRIAVPIACRSS